MIEAGVFEIIKSTFEYIFLPVIAAFAFFLRKYITKVENTETKIVSLDIRLAVVESKLADIRNDLKVIKRGVVKLVDKENARP